MELIAQLMSSAASTTVLHPITFAKTLIQLGHEPFPPKPATNWFGVKSLLYPNTFKYLGHIYQKDGFIGLYRGLGFNLVTSFVSSYVSSNVHSALVQPLSSGVNEATVFSPSARSEGSCSVSDNGPFKLCKDTLNDIISQSAAIIVCQPFYVVCIRSMSQFIGREDEYSSLLPSFSLLWKTEGLSGFFAGLIPRLLGEVLTIALSNILSYLINNIILNTNPLQDKEIREYLGKFSSWIATNTMYPFTVVANVMVVNGCTNLAIGRVYSYDGWIECLTSLASQNELRRGSSLFWRKYQGPMMIDSSVKTSRAQYVPSTRL